jgi:hypothetical protein
LNFWSFKLFWSWRFVFSKRSFKFDMNIFDASEFFSTHRKMNLSQFELFRFVSNYLINLKSFCMISSFCRFLKTNVDATLRWLFDETNIIFSSNNDESSLLFEND